MKFRKFKHILNGRYLLSSLYLRDSSLKENMSCHIGGIIDSGLFNVIDDYADENKVEWNMNVYICFEL